MAEVKINGVAYSGKNVQINVALQGLTKDGKPVPKKTLQVIKGWTEIEYTPTINREWFYGADQLPQADTDGQLEFSGTWTVSRDVWNYIVDSCQDQKIPLALAQFTIGVTYAKAGATPKTDTITRVKLQEVGSSVSTDGGEVSLTTLTLFIGNIYANGEDYLGNKL